MKRSAWGGTRAVGAVAVFLLALVLALAGCGEAPPPGQEILVEVEEGTPQDEVLALLPDGGLDETADRRVSHGYRWQRFLTGGQMVEVVWIHREGAGEEIVDPRLELTPVIFRDEVLDGWGWSHYDARSEEWNLGSPPAGTGAGS